MKRIIGLLVFLLLLCGIAYLAINWNSKRNNSTIDTYDRSFRIEDQSEIQKIFIAQKTGPPVTLERKGDHWMVNDKYKAHDNKVMRLLKVMTEIRMKYIPHPNAVPNAIKEIGLIGIKVEVYDDSNKKLKTYYVGGGTADELGTYMLMDGADQPYVMDMTSYEGSVRGRFVLSELEWRDKTFIAEDVDNIKRVKVYYPKYQSDSFILNIEEQTVESTNTSDAGEKVNAKPGSIKAYLKTMEKIGSEKIKNTYADKDSIKTLVPFMTLTVTHKKGLDNVYRFFPLEDLETTRNTKNVRETKGVERYFVDCPNGDFVLAQHLLVKGLLRSIDYFRE